MEWKLFADLAEIAGGREIDVAAEPGDTVGDALDALLEAHPTFAIGCSTTARSRTTLTFSGTVRTSARTAGWTRRSKPATSWRCSRP